jgi:hypothetical protein
LFKLDGLCVSQCQNCGTICEAFPITDINSAQLYSGKECTIITGDLYIQDLPTSVTKKLLFDSLQTVRHIRGDLYFLDNPFISAMTFFSNLEGLHGAHYSNNAQLVDARMPSLEQLSGAVTVEGCDRLCPARYTTVGTVAEDDACPNPTIEYYFEIKGDASGDMIWVIRNAFARLLTNVTDGEVCRCCSLKLHFCSLYISTLSGMAA